MADAHSRIELNAIAAQSQSRVNDFKKLAAAQEDSHLQQMTQDNSSLSLKSMQAPQMTCYFVMYQPELPTHMFPLIL